MQKFSFEEIKILKFRDRGHFGHQLGFQGHATDLGQGRGHGLGPSASHGLFGACHFVLRVS